MSGPNPKPVSRAAHVGCRDLATILNFCRPLVAAGKPSLFCSLLKHRQEPRSGIFNALTLAPAFLPVPVLHASNRHQKDTRDHGNYYPQHG